MHLIADATLKAYKGTLRNFFAYTRSKEYDSGHEFTQDDIDSATREQVLAWLNFRAYGTPDPVYGPNLKAILRVNTIKQYKKAISYFLQDDRAKSSDLNKSIRLAKLLQVRKNGKKPQARDPLDHPMFQHLIEVLKKEEKSSSYILSHGIPAMLCFQFAMIGRVDDVTQFQLSNLRDHEDFPTDALQAQFSWSKNVHDERQAPWQMLLGSTMTTYCVLVNMGIWIECHHSKTPGASASPYVFSFSGDHSVPAGGRKAKDLVTNKFSKIFKGDNYEGKGTFGSHSIRKYAVTYCRNSGVCKDDYEYRGRWRDSRRVTSTYEHPTLPFIDAKGCFALCQGGACSYVPSACIDQNFLCTQVAPHIKAALGPNVAKLLGSAVMWAVFAKPEIVPVFLRERILGAYNALPNKLPEGINPIRRRQLHLVQVKDGSGKFQLLDITSQTQHQGRELVVDGQNDYLMIISNQLTEVRQGQIEVGTRMDQLDGRMVQQQKIFTSALNRISRQPHRMLQNAAIDATNVAVAAAANGAVVRPEQLNIAHMAAGMHAMLCPSPKNLYELWTEYIEGIAGSKPARDFSPKERGRCKVKYCRRKAFWKLVETQIIVGYPADVAIDRIYNAYGTDLPVTTILNNIMTDRKDGTVPQSLQSTRLVHP